MRRCRSRNPQFLALQTQQLAWLDAVRDAGSIMDLRPLIKSDRQLEEARRLALRGLLSYQPYIFSDTFAVGAGLSILAGHLKEPPAVYCPEATANDTDPAFFAKEFAKDDQREEFFAANEAMRRFYDGVVDQIADAVGPLQDLSILDVGCNTGYFPLAFARKGARSAKGIDRIDYTPTVSLLNEICGTSVQFAPWNYDGSIVATEQYDLVLSVAVLVHLGEPLRHLAWLGSTARKALMVFTPFHDADDYSIQFHAVNRYYVDAQFPQCFDITTVSEKLLRLAFDKMGFSRVVNITAAQTTMPPRWANRHLGLLGIRDDFLPRASGGTAQHATTSEAQAQNFESRVAEQLLPLNRRLLAIEDTLEERTVRLRSLEMDSEERSARLRAIEQTLKDRERAQCFWQRMARAIKLRKPTV